MSNRVTDLSVGGFKSFGLGQSMPLRPITLVFGANSSGKSSLLHSLLWLNQAQSSGCANAGQIELSGEKVDLGNFASILHRHEQNQAITFGFSAPGESLFDPADPDAFALLVSDLAGSFPFQVDLAFRQVSFPIDGQVRAELKPRLVSYEASSEGKMFFNAVREPNGFIRLDPQCLDHELWQNRVVRAYAEDNVLKNEAIIAEAHRVITALLNTFLSGSGGEMVRQFEGFTARQVVECMSHVLDIPRGELEEDRFRPFTDCLNNFLEPVFSLVPTFLRTLSYLGPLRRLPDRDDFRRDRSRRAVGDESWNTLLDDDHVRTLVNKFFGQKFRFKPYEFVRKSYFGDGERIDDLVLMDLQTKTQVTHRDVGVGIIQILPVLVQALASKDKTIMIEQPELHIHPALQAEMGDVFIRSALGEQRNRFILETHSEHLILRLLRRIRQSTENSTTGYPEDLPRITPEDVSVIYAKPTEKGTQLIPLHVTPDGDFVEQWPDGFFTERGRELFA
jgi:hypothetical protein